MFLAARTGQTGTLSVLDEFVLVAGQKFAHSLQVLNSNLVDFDAEGPNYERARIVFHREIQWVAQHGCAFQTVADRVILQLGYDVLLSAKTSGSDECDSCGEVGQQKLDLAELGSLAADFFLWFLHRHWYNCFHCK